MATNQIQKAGPVPSVSPYTMRKLFERPGLSFSSDAVINVHCGRLTQRLWCFSGTQSMLTPAAEIKLPKDRAYKISGQEFTSIDNYLWTMKFKELLNKPLPSKSQIIGYRGILRANHITYERQDEWMLERGLLHLQKAILRRVQMDFDFYLNLVGTGDRVLVYTYHKDRFLSAGSDYKDVRQWFQECASNNMLFQIPNKFPLTMNDLHNLPQILGGRNVLGAIYMSLREQLKHNNPWHMKVEIPPIKVVPAPYPNSFGEFHPKKRRNSEEIEIDEPKRRSTEPPSTFDGSVHEQSSFDSGFNQASGSSVTHSYAGFAQNSTPIKPKSYVQNNFRHRRQTFGSTASAASSKFHSAVTNFDRRSQDQASYTAASTVTYHSPVITPASSFARLNIDTPNSSENGDCAQEVSHEEQRLMEAVNCVLPQELDMSCTDSNSSTEAHERFMNVKGESPWGDLNWPAPKYVSDDLQSITPSEESRLLKGETEICDMDDDAICKFLQG